MKKVAYIFTQGERMFTFCLTVNVRSLFIVVHLIIKIYEIHNISNGACIIGSNC